MISDEERREAARRLRGLEVCELDGEFIDCGEVEDTLGLVSDDGAWYEAQGVIRLADLIDPGDTSQGCRDTVACDPIERGVDSIYDWCFERIEGADEAEDYLYCSIMSAIEEYRHPVFAVARSVRPVDRDALSALADNLDSSASMLLKQNDLDPNRKRRGMRRDHAQSLMAASGRIREALGVGR